MDDPRPQIFTSISIEESHILPFEGFIFLCGGALDATVDPPISVREALRRQFARIPDLDERIRLAEDYKDWYFDSHYSDLLEFEDHIAELSAAIILVLESPGSMTELGMFSSFDHFRDKLIVVMSNYHYQGTSFIRLGPIKYLEQIKGNPSECFPWVEEKFGREIHSREKISELETEIFQSVSSRIGSVTTGAVFRHDRWLHEALLICEIIGLAAALTVTEVKDYLALLGIERSQGEIKKTLFMLEKMHMIAVEARSSQRFYMSVLDREFMNLKAGSNFDRGKLRFRIIEFYERFDKRRYRAIQEVRRRNV